MSITMNYAAGRKGKRVSSSPSHSNHSPPTASSPLPKIKLNVRPSPHSRPATASDQRSRAGPSIQRRSIFSDDSSSDLTPAEDEDDDNDDDDEDLTEDEFPMITSASRKAKKRDSISHTTPTTVKDKGKAKEFTLHSSPHIAYNPPSSDSRPSPVGPNGRDRKRIIKLGEVARRRARDDKFGFGGDRFGGASRIGSSYIESDSTSSYGDDESERENGLSGMDDETDDEFMGTLPEALAGQEVEDLAYGGGAVDFGMDEEVEQQWWQEEEEDEDFIANLSGSDIEGLQSQSSAHASESDDPMTSSTSENESDDTMDEFGFPHPFAVQEEQPSDAPLILMENWDGQFVLVQPRSEKTRSRRTKNGSGTAGSIGESTSLSAGEQQLMIDDDANDDTDTDWSGFEGEDDGGDTTDSMAEEDMPVLDSPALDEIIGQQLASNYSSLSSSTVLDMDMFNPDMLNPDIFNPAIVVTDTTVETPPLSTTVSASVIGSPVTTTTSPPMVGLPSAPSTPITTLPAPVPMMGTFNVSRAPCAHAVIDGSKTTTKSPFTRKRRGSKISEMASVAAKRRSHIPTADPLSPMGKKSRYSSIPGHPRFIAARRAAQSLVDPLDCENTSEEEDNAFSLEDMLDASMLHMNDLEPSSSSAPAVQPELRHLFRFDKVPVSMYMRRNFNSSAIPKPRQVEPAPPVHAWNYAAPPPRTPGIATGRTNLSDTLADTLAGPASRMLISPLLQPMSSSDVDDLPMSRKDRRKAKRRGSDMMPLQI